MSVSCKRGAHFQKIVFITLGLTIRWFFDVLGCFGDPFWGAKVEPKGLRKSSKKWSAFGTALWTALGCQRGRRGSPTPPGVGEVRGMGVGGQGYRRLSGVMRGYEFFRI